MKARVHIELEYFANEGEYLMYCPRSNYNTETQPAKYQMKNIGNGIWEYESDTYDCNHFHFEVWKDSTLIRQEVEYHCLPLNSNNEYTFDIKCRWQEGVIPVANFVYLPDTWEDIKVNMLDEVEPNMRIMSVLSSSYQPQYTLAISSSSYNNWKELKFLDNKGEANWYFVFDKNLELEYKYILYDRITGDWYWEEGENRHIKPSLNTTDIQYFEDRSPVFNVNQWKAVGTAIPLFSLRSNDSFGIGEFQDLKKLADWAELTGQKMIQLLPINDTTMTNTWRDSYPYNANSANALHPQYINLVQAGFKESQYYRKLKEELNSLEYVDYEKVNNYKKFLLRDLYEDSEELVNSEDFKSFVKENDSWLLDYAVYSCLRDKNGTSNYRDWEEYAQYSEEKVKAYYENNKYEVEFYFYVQYLAQQQLRSAVHYANSRGVMLKGDLPIGVSRDSSDTWISPKFFNMNGQAGAPPDAFAEDGQNWGFPTYDWKEIAKDGYSWWRTRFINMFSCFSAYRIDHILGFFRIWEIPMEYKSGLMGHFNPALPYSKEELRDLGFSVRKSKSQDVLFVADSKKDYYHPRINANKTKSYSKLKLEQKQTFDKLYEDFFYHRNEKMWKEKAIVKLLALKDLSCGMMPCAEDLGMIPASVPEVLNELKILSLEVERMPKAFGREFGDTTTYPYLSVCTTGTHDTSTLREWWEEDYQRSQRYYQNVLGLVGQAPKTLSPELAQLIIERHLDSPSMMAIFPLQDWLAMDENLRYNGDIHKERINDPSNPNQFWSYRMHINLEKLVEANQFNDKIRAMVKASERW